MDVAKPLFVGENISVKIEDVLPDIILVSFQYGSKIFQGVLLEATKKQIPCGIYSQDPKFCDDPSADKLYSIKQRFTYFQNEYNQKPPPIKPKGINKSKNGRMTVRLRPRQVLCSNCQSICNEKSENVSSNKLPRPQSSTHMKMISENSVAPIDNIHSNRRLLNSKRMKEPRSCRETRQTTNFISNSNSFSNNKPNSYAHTANPVLVPKLIKLKASDIESATGNGITSSLPMDTAKLGNSQVTLSQVQVPLSTESEEITDLEGKLPKLKLTSNLPSRKKGKMLKVTISTNPSNLDSTKECGIRTRSRGSVDERSEDSVVTDNTMPGTFIKSNSPVLKPLNETVEKKDSDIIRAKKCSEFNICKNSDSESNDKHSKFSGGISDESLSSNASLPKLTIIPVSSKNVENLDSKNSVEKSEKMNLRKKRSVGSMEDLWDENVFSDTKKLKSENKETGSSVSSEDGEGGTDSEKPKTTPILKISFGPGKGTVLKIPAKSTVSENDSTEPEDQNDTLKRNKNIISKAARKALKRAKREAQKKSTTSAVFISKARFGGKSPLSLGGISPARISGFSPGRFGGASPGRFGGTSPGRFGGTSPGRFGGTSPGRFGGTSPGRFGGASPGRFGGASPARFGGGSSSILSGMMSPRSNVEGFIRSQSRKHKHKMKHKKKHKEDRKHKSDENVEPSSAAVKAETKDDEPLAEMINIDASVEKMTENVWKVPSPPDQPLTNFSNNIESPKQNALQNTRHKLSISIKRVSNASYITCDPNNEGSPEDIDSVSYLESQDPVVAVEERISNSTEHKDLNKKQSYEENDFNYLNVHETDIGSDPNQSSDDNSDVPDFPWIACGNTEQEEEAALILMKLGWHDVESCEVPEGCFKVGDIVWGKVNDLPWWPAKITRLKVSNDTCHVHQAQVCWYGSSSKSLLSMDHLQPFLKKFNVRYRKRKEGPYQDAVREASFEADRIQNDDERPLSICESPITASPREVNVVS